LSDLLLWVIFLGYRHTADTCLISARNNVSKALFFCSRRCCHPFSDTEQEALDAGTVMVGRRAVQRPNLTGTGLHSFPKPT